MTFNLLVRSLIENVVEGQLFEPNEEHHLLSNSHPFFIRFGADVAFQDCVMIQLLVKGLVAHIVGDKSDRSMGLIPI